MSPILHLDSLVLHLWRSQMASDDRVWAACETYFGHMAGLSFKSEARRETQLAAMSAALDAADAVALTPAQREADGMLAVLRGLTKLQGHALASIPAILARIDGGK
jgi:hypothetical protein